MLMKTYLEPMVVTCVFSAWDKRHVTRNTIEGFCATLVQAHAW
jgi:hypothetical protein